MRDRLAGASAVAVMIGGWVGLSASRAAAQTPPFFGGGVIAYDPVPATVFSGAVLDAQPVVSDDRRYVTLNMRTTNSRLRQLVNFPVANVNAVQQGFVGGVVFPGSETPTPIGKASSPGARPTSPGPGMKAPSPDAIDRAGKSWILAREGMYLVAPLR